MVIGFTAFPGGVDTLDTLLRLGLGVETHLKAPITATAASLRVGDPALLSPSGVLVVENEYVTYTAIVGDTVTVETRGAFAGDGGYPASDHADGARVRQVMLPSHHRVLADAIIAVETELSGGITLDDLSDVAVTTPANRHGLFHNGTSWVNRQPQIDDLSDVGGITAILTGTTTYNPPNLVNGSQDTSTVTVTGAAQGDTCEAGHSSVDAGFELNCAVSAADTCTIVLINRTGGTRDLPSGTMRCTVTRH